MYATQFFLVWPQLGQARPILHSPPALCWKSGEDGLRLPDEAGRWWMNRLHVPATHEDRWRGIGESPAAQDPETKVLAGTPTNFHEVLKGEVVGLPARAAGRIPLTAALREMPKLRSCMKPAVGPVETI